MTMRTNSFFFTSWVPSRSKFSVCPAHEIEIYPRPILLWELTLRWRLWKDLQHVADTVRREEVWWKFSSSQSAIRGSDIPKVTLEKSRVSYSMTTWIGTHDYCVFLSRVHKNSIFLNDSTPLFPRTSILFVVWVSSSSLIWIVQFRTTQTKTQDSLDPICHWCI